MRIGYVTIFFHRYVQLVKDSIATVPQDFLYAAFDASSINVSGIKNAPGITDTKVNTYEQYFVSTALSQD